MAIYGYLRISKDTSDLENQRTDIYNCSILSESEKSQIVWTEEIISGRVNAEDRQLGELVSKIQKGDTIICADVSRLGRNTLDVASVGSEIMKRKARLIFARENEELKDEIGSEIVFFAFSLAARIERQMISARTKTALVRAKSEGKKLGRKEGFRPRVLVDNKDEILKLRRQGLSFQNIAKIYDVARQTVSSYLKEIKE